MKPDFENQYYECYFVDNHWRVLPKYSDKWGYLAGPTNRIVLKEDANKSITPH